MQIIYMVFQLVNIYHIFTISKCLNEKETDKFDVNLVGKIIR